MFSNMSIFLPVESCEEWTFSEQLHCTLMFNKLGQGRTFWMEVYPWHFGLLKILKFWCVCYSLIASIARNVFPAFWTTFSESSVSCLNLDQVAHCGMALAALDDHLAHLPRCDGRDSWIGNSNSEEHMDIAQHRFLAGQVNEENISAKPSQIFLWYYLLYTRIHKKSIVCAMFRI